jgi:hypothetical protein
VGIVISVARTIGTNLFPIDTHTPFTQSILLA